MKKCNFLTSYTFVLSLFLLAAISGCEYTENKGVVQFSDGISDSINQKTVAPYNSRQNTDPETEDRTPPSPTPNISDTATAIAVTSISISWSASSDSVSGMAGYKVKVTSPQNQTTTSALLSGTTFTAMSLAGNTSYVFVVDAIDNSGNIASSNAKTFTTQSPSSSADVAAPTPKPTINASATLTQNSISFTWTPSTDAGSGMAGYIVYVDGTAQSLSPVNYTSLAFTASGFSPSTQHTFKVRAQDVTGNFIDSTEKSFTTSAAPVNPPPTGGNLVSVDVPNSQGIMNARGVAFNPSVYGPQASHDCPANQAAGHIYIDTNYTGTDSNGSYNKPYKTLLITATPAAGTKFCIKRGSVVRIVDGGNSTGIWRINNFNGTPNSPPAESQNPVVLTSYGDSSQAPPKILGSYGVNSAWTVDSTGSTVDIYKTNVSSLLASGENVEAVVINGIMKNEARYPDSGWITKDADSSGDSYTNHYIKINSSVYSQLSSVLGSDLNTANFSNSGIKAILRDTSWSIIPTKVSSITNGKIFIDSFTEYGLGYYSINGSFYNEQYGFFLRGHKKLISTAGEWSFDRATGMLYVGVAKGGAAPSNVELMPYSGPIHSDGGTTSGKRGAAFLLDHLHNITFQNLEFANFPYSAFSLSQSAHIKFKNNKFINSARAIRSWEDLNTDIDSNFFTNIYIDGIKSVGGKSPEISNNYFRDISLIPGTSYSAWTYFGIDMGGYIGYSYNIHNNIIINTGYISVGAYGPGTIKQNYIQKPLEMLNDGGGIAFDTNPLNAADMVHDQNIVNNCMGNTDGTPPGKGPECIGIYYGNHQLNNAKMRNNTVINTASGTGIDHSYTSLDSISTCFGSTYPSGCNNKGPTRGHEVTNNTFFGFTLTGAWHTDYSTYTYAGAPGHANSYLNYPTESAWYLNSEYNDKVTGNIFYAGTQDATMQNLLYVYGGNGSLDSVTGLVKHTNFFGTIGNVAGGSNNNTYYSPYGANTTMSRVQCNHGGWTTSSGVVNRACDTIPAANKRLTFAQWKASPAAYSVSNPSAALGTGQDSNSTYTTGSPAINPVAAANQGVIYFNNTNSEHTFNLPQGCFVKLKNNQASPEEITSLILAPYTSQIVVRKSTAANCQ